MAASGVTSVEVRYSAMTVDPASDVVRWVKEGEHLFRLTLGRLQAAADLQARVDALAGENKNLREANQELRRELDLLRGERLEAAESFKALAEHVTRLATVAIQRLGHAGPSGGGAGP